MYNIKDTGADLGQYQTGDNEAQVFYFKPIVEASKYNAIQQERKAAAQQKLEQDNKDDIMKQVAGMQGKAIMSHDSPLIEAQQMELMDWASKNGDKLWKGDPSTTMAFNQKMAQLQQATAISVDKRKRVEDSVRHVSENKDKYLPGTYEKLVKFVGSEYAGKNFNEGDYLTPDFNIDKMASDILTQRQKTSKGDLTETANPLTGSTRTTQSNENTLEQSKEQIKQGILSDDSAIRKSIWMMGKADDAIKKKYGFDPNNPESQESLAGAINYVTDLTAPRNVYSENIDKKTAGWKPDSEDGQGNIVTHTTDRPQSYKIESPSTGGGTKEATVDVAQSATLAKPITMDLTMTTSVRDINGNTLPKVKGVFKVTGSDIKVVPVYKPGTKREGSDVSMAGNVIPSERIGDAKDKGVIEYKPMFYGTAKVPDVDDDGEQLTSEPDGNGNSRPLFKDISITKPAEELKGALGKSQKTLDAMNKYADDLNKGLSSGGKYTQSEEAGISNVMKHNSITRAEAIKALKNAGKIK